MGRGGVSACLLVIGLAACRPPPDSGDAGTLDADTVDAAPVTRTVCTASELTAALAASVAGDSVLVEACQLEGNFTLPAGVTLQGRGAAQTVLRAAPGAPALTLLPGGARTVVRDLALEVFASQSALRLEGQGQSRVSLSGLVVTANLTFTFVNPSRDPDAAHVAVYLGDAVEVTIDDVRVVGPTQDSAAASMTQIGERLYPRYGLALVRCAAATLTRVSVLGFARVGLGAWDTTVTIRNSTIGPTAWAGLMVEGGQATLEDVTSCNTLQVVAPAYAVLLVRTSATTSRLKVCRSERYGLVMLDSTTSHAALEAVDNTDAAVFIEGGAATIANATIARNKGWGLMGFKVGNLQLRDSTIIETAITPRANGMTAVSFGDGIELLGSTGTLSNLTLSGHQRVALLIDGLNTTDVTLSGAIAITASGTANGAILQTPAGLAAIGSGWDGAIMRNASADANDRARTTLLPTYRESFAMPPRLP